jgi:hypothetical protein
MGTPPFFPYMYVGHNKNHGFFLSMFIATRTGGNVTPHVTFMVFFITLGTGGNFTPPFFDVHHNKNLPNFVFFSIIAATKGYPFFGFISSQ